MFVFFFKVDADSMHIPTVRGNHMNDCIMFTAEYLRHPQANHLNQTRSSGAAPWAVLGPVAALCEFRSLILFGGCQNWPKIKFDHSFKQNI